MKTILDTLMNKDRSTLTNDQAMLCEIAQRRMDGTLREVARVRYGWQSALRTGEILFTMPYLGHRTL